MSHIESTLLHKRAVLITADPVPSPLARALCQQLTETHRCRVALVTGPGRTPEVNVASAALFECNFANRQQVGELIATLERQLGQELELVIYLDSVNSSADLAVEQFVEQTSSEILLFVNLLTNFVPSMAKHASGGRIVSIKDASASRSRAFQDSQSEYHDLVRSILAGDPSKSTVQLSTIFCDRLQSAEPAHQDFAQRTLHAIDESANRNSGSSAIWLRTRRDNLFQFWSSNLLQLATIGLDKLQLRKTRELPFKVQ